MMSRSWIFPTSYRTHGLRNYLARIYTSLESEFACLLTCNYELLNERCSTSIWGIGELSWQLLLEHVLDKLKSSWTKTTSRLETTLCDSGFHKRNAFGWCWYPIMMVGNVRGVSLAWCLCWWSNQIAKTRPAFYRARHALIPLSAHWENIFPSSV